MWKIQAQWEPLTKYVKVNVASEPKEKSLVKTMSANVAATAPRGE